MEHETSSQDDQLPAGAEACTLPETPRMDQAQISAGVVFLVNQLKRKSAYSDDEKFFLEEFKAVSPVYVDSITELDQEINVIKSTFQLHRSMTNEMQSAFATLRGLLFIQGSHHKLSEALLENIKSCESNLKDAIRDTRFVIARDCVSLLCFGALLCKRKFAEIVDPLVPHIFGMLTSKQKLSPDSLKTILEMIYLPIYCKGISNMKICSH